jgi:hypothetical protein
MSTVTRSFNASAAAVSAVNGASVCNTVASIVGFVVNKEFQVHSLFISIVNVSSAQVVATVHKDNSAQITLKGSSA